MTREASFDDEAVQRGLAEDRVRVDRTGTQEDLVLGLVLGFAMSLLAIVVMTEIRHTITFKARFGIFLGFIGNAAVSMFHLSSLFGTSSG